MELVLFGRQVYFGQCLLEEDMLRKIPSQVSGSELKVKWSSTPPALCDCVKALAYLTKLYVV